MHVYQGLLQNIRILRPPKQRNNVYLMCMTRKCMIYGLINYSGSQANMNNNINKTIPQRKKLG